MPRVQSIVVRDNWVLMVKHQQDGQEWWCLPGGGQESDETPAQGTLRELQEECNVSGVVVRQTAHVCYGPEDETYSFLERVMYFDTANDYTEGHEQKTLSQ